MELNQFQNPYKLIPLLLFLILQVLKIIIYIDKYPLFLKIIILVIMELHSFHNLLYLTPLSLILILEVLKFIGLSHKYLIFIFQDDDIGDDGAKSIWLALQFNSTLTTLHLKSIFNYHSYI